MLSKILSAGVLAVAMLAAFPDRAAPADVSVGVNIGVFHQRLAAYGEWIPVGSYGLCWRPRHLVRAWRPYRVGYWVYRDYGWTWVSDEPWGWATYHYGRWFYDPHYGWVWVPGTRWAPAYVTWRYNDDWIGWAPLPPGFEPGVFMHLDIEPSAYSFVQTRYFLDRRLGGHFAASSRNAVLLGSTQDATRFEIRGSRIIDHGVDPRRIERVLGRRMTELRVRDSAAATRDRVGNHDRHVPGREPGRAAPQIEQGLLRARVTSQERHAQPQRAHPAPSHERQEAPARQERGTSGRAPSGGGHGGRGGGGNDRAGGDHAHGGGDHGQGAGGHRQG